MRAVNLIPSDDRPGAGGAAGRSGGAAYVLLGGMALAVAMFGAYTKTDATLHDKQAKVASLEQQATAAEARAASLQAYTQFATLRTKRVATVKQLAAGRFDWAHALHEVSRVLPANAWLTQLIGTTAPGVTVDGASASTSALRSAVAAPAIEIAGCTTSQASVAKMMARMRLVDGVQRVTLANSAKSDSAAGSAPSTGGGSGGGCDVSSHFPTFNMVVFFRPQAGGSAGTAGGATTTAAAAAAGAATTAAATTATATTPTSTTPTTTGGSK